MHLVSGQFYILGFCHWKPLAKGHLDTPQVLLSRAAPPSAPVASLLQADHTIHFSTLKSTQNSSAPSSFDGHLEINLHCPFLFFTLEKVPFKQLLNYLKFPIWMICSLFQVRSTSIFFVIYGSSSAFSCQSCSPATKFFSILSYHIHPTHISTSVRAALPKKT